jgi:hypothetical protein
MSDVNIVKKYTRLGDLSTKNLLFKNMRAVIVGYERVILQLLADCYKELLIPLGEGIVPEENVYSGLYQDIRTFSIQEGPAMIRKLKNNWAPVENSLTAQLIKPGGRMLWRKNPYTDGECGRKHKCQRSRIVPSYAQCIKRLTRWSVITTK